MHQSFKASPYEVPVQSYASLSSQPILVIRNIVLSISWVASPCNCHCTRLAELLPEGCLRGICLGNALLPICQRRTYSGACIIHLFLAWVTCSVGATSFTGLTVLSQCGPTSAVPPTLGPFIGTLVSLDILASEIYPLKS